MVVATVSGKAALLVGNVTDRIISQLRLYKLSPQRQQDLLGYRHEFVVVLRNADQKQAFEIAAKNLRITIK
jgi:Na+-transporting NADH:ubiquinone oxidoreductase subunit NqrA